MAKKLPVQLVRDTLRAKAEAIAVYLADILAANDSTY